MGRGLKQRRGPCCGAPATLPCCEPARRVCTVKVSVPKKKIKVEQLTMLAAPGALKPPCRRWEQPAKLAANPVSPSSSQWTGHPCRGLLLLPAGILGARVQALQQGNAHGNPLLAPALPALRQSAFYCCCWSSFILPPFATGLIRMLSHSTGPSSAQELLLG